MLLQLSDFSPEPLYRQLARQLADRIRRGDLRGRLDSIRCMARGQRISIFTVERAYNELINAGLVESRQDSTFVIPPNVPRSSVREQVAQRAYNSIDLMLAQKIQKNFLPATSISDEYVSIVAASEACELVGGDMYDYFRIDDSRYGLVIADACGHGFPAALLISQIQAIIKSEVKNGSSLSETMNFINSHIRATFLKGKFITLFYGIYDAGQEQLVYINAGHNFPILVKKNGEHEFLTQSSPALGLAHDITFNIGHMHLDAGDRLFLYTDGITEAMNKNREEFGEERLLQMIKENRHQQPKDLLKLILNATAQHGQTKFLDDRTMMIFDIRKNHEKNARCA